MDFFPSNVKQKPVEIAKAALADAKLKFYDVLIVDTAGRLHVDSEMMDEIKQVHATFKSNRDSLHRWCNDRSRRSKYSKSLNEPCRLLGLS